jgi:phosphoserine aminotransferase
MKPTALPRVPLFSSGPCTKRPGWGPAELANAALGRSHRSKIGKSKLQDVLDRSRSLLGLPDDYRIAIVPASDTGAFEMAMWSLLGPRGIDVLAWESFGTGWASDITNQLRLEDVRVMRAEYGAIPDLAQVDFARDVIFTWNGTTSGARVPNGDWIPAGREGLTLCDATSAAFAMEIPWDKIDVATWSWQKVLGGEAAHGMLILSPRAVERLETHTPAWPMPKIFRLTKGGKLIEGVFRGETINTPSMLAVEDMLDALGWAEAIGGLDALIDRSRANLEAIETWVAISDWCGFMVADPSIRSSSSICLKVIDPWFEALDIDVQAGFAKRVVAMLEAECAAFDIGGHRDAPPGFRIWGGATVESSDIAAMPPWLDWAYGEAKAELARAA